MNYPTWWIDPDYEDDLHDQSLHAEVAHVSLLLQLQYPLGPWQPLAPGENFASFKSWLTLFGTQIIHLNTCFTSPALLGLSLSCLLLLSPMPLDQPPHIYYNIIYQSIIHGTL
eukprot:COSAG05_NODE_1668_length_4309_cov_3.260570_5_plen_113_part_00